MAARDAVVAILKGWAREGRTDTYKALSEAVAPEHGVHYHGRMMSLLPADVCRRDSTGPEPMLSAPVVNGSGRKPFDRFLEPAVTGFRRRSRVRPGPRTCPAAAPPLPAPPEAVRPYAWAIPASLPVPGPGWRGGGERCFLPALAASHWRPRALREEGIKTSR
ncbi:hypothetical protein GCM10010266_46960 [Streptomyces griseomycini]|nr:hypothetical protein GCM10010266_46960 [Streptomyces griseomycini]